MSKYSNEILLALAYVSQITDPDSVRSRFIESLNALDDAFTFKFVDRLPSGLPENRSLPIATLRSSFGFAVMAEGPKTSEIERVVFRNAFQFLAVILENRLQASALKSKNESLLKEINHEKSLVRTVLDTLPVGVWVADEKGTILMGNAAGEEIWAGARYIGIDQYSEYKARWSDTGERIKSDEWALARAIKMGETSINQEIDIECFDGTRKTILNSAAPLLDDERRIIGAVGINQDITERKRAEKLLRESEEKFRKAFNNGPDSVNINCLEDGMYVSINPGFTRITGYTEEDIIGKTSIECNIWENIEDRQRLVAGLKKDGEVINLEATFRMKSSDIRHGLMSASIVDLNGIPHIISITRDITERKQAEEALRKSETQYRLLAENVNDVIFVLDMNLNYTYVSPSIKFLRGYKPEEVLKQAAVQALTPASRELAMETISEIMELEKSGRRETPLSRTLQLEMVRKDGTTVWTEVKFSFIRDEDQRLMSILGLTRDVTERRRAEKELKESKMLLESVFNSSQDLILVIDRDLRVLMSNWKSPLYAGHTEFPINSHCFEAFIKRDTPCEPCHALGVFNTGKPVLVEYYNQYTKLYREVSAYPIFDDNNHVIMVAEEVRDITNRKLAEKKLQDALESLREAFGATVQVMVTAVEARDPYTAGHQLRSADLAQAIATEMVLPQEIIDGIRMAGSIHDIGKLSIPAEILSKPTKLTSLEFSLIKLHSLKGYEMLKDVESPWPLAQIVYQHHERMDGSGYPRNLKGDEILLEARIMAVADVVESMASHRPYRPALGIGVALGEIEKNKGILYDQAVADACLRLFREKGYQLEEA